MLLANLTGGLNTRVAPHLLNEAQCVVAENVDTTTGVLRPIKGLSLVDEPNTEYHPWFSSIHNKKFPLDGIKDYLVYKNQILSSDGINAKKYIDGTWYNLGLEKPDGTLTPTLLDAVSTQEFKLNTAFAKDSYFKHGEQVYLVIVDIPNSNTTSLVGLLGELKVIKYNGVVREVTYCYTYYNNSDGTESSPSDISAKVELPLPSTRLNIRLTGFKDSSDNQATHIIFYRLGGGLTKFTEVSRLAIGSWTDSTTIPAVIDNKEIKDIVLFRFMETVANTPARGLMWLQRFENRFFGARETKIYFTSDANPNYWPQTNYLELNDRITGLSVTTNGLVVFTRTSTWIVTSNLRLRLIDSTTGCINSNSIAKAGNLVIFAAVEGIKSISESGIQHFVETLIPSTEFKVVTCVFINRCYHLLLEDKTMLSIDFKNGLVITKNNFNLNWIYVVRDKLFGNDDSNTYELFKGLTYSYIVETKDYKNNKYTKLRIHASDKVTVKAYGDNELLGTFEVIGDRLPEDFNLKNLRFSFIRLRLEGTATIYSMELL